MRACVRACVLGLCACVRMVVVVGVGGYVRKPLEEISASGRDLVARMLTYNPAKRISADQVPPPLSHLGRHPQPRILARGAGVCLLSQHAVRAFASEPGPAASCWRGAARHRR